MHFCRAPFVAPEFCPVGQLPAGFPGLGAGVIAALATPLAARARPVVNRAMRFFIKTPRWSVDEVPP